MGHLNVGESTLIFPIELRRKSLYTDYGNLHQGFLLIKKLYKKKLHLNP